SWVETDIKEPPCSCTYADTLVRYVFDNEGRIIEETHFQNPIYSSTNYYDTLGNLILISSTFKKGSKIDSSRHVLDGTVDTTSYKQTWERKKVNTDSIYIITTFIKFTQGLDTATVKMMRYNAQGKL